MTSIETPLSSGRALRRLRIALAAGVASLLVAGIPADGAARGMAFPYGWYGDWYAPAAPIPSRKARVAPSRRQKSKSKKEAGFGEMPKGPLQIVVSIETQRVTLFSNGVRVAQGPVSTGVPGHPTPMGVFSIIEKDRYHHSNLYSNAPMPYMQRITWSGVALHEGVLPGYPASHGCIRMSHDFAQKLWRVTKLGVRVSWLATSWRRSISRTLICSGQSPSRRSPRSPSASPTDADPRRRSCRRRKSPRPIATTSERRRKPPPRGRLRTRPLMGKPSTRRQPSKQVKERRPAAWRDQSKSSRSRRRGAMPRMRRKSSRRASRRRGKEAAPRRGRAMQRRVLGAPPACAGRRSGEPAADQGCRGADHAQRAGCGVREPQGTKDSMFGRVSCRCSTCCPS